MQTVSFHYAPGGIAYGIFSLEVFTDSIHSHSCRVTLQIGEYEEFRDVSGHVVRMAREPPTRSNSCDVITIGSLDSKYPPPTFSALPHIVCFSVAVSNTDQPSLRVVAGVRFDDRKDRQSFRYLLRKSIDLQVIGAVEVGSRKLIELIEFQGGCRRGIRLSQGIRGSNIVPRAYRVTILVGFCQTVC